MTKVGDFICSSIESSFVSGSLSPVGWRGIQPKVSINPTSFSYLSNRRRFWHSSEMVFENHNITSRYKPTRLRDLAQVVSEKKFKTFKRFNKQFHLDSKRINLYWHKFNFCIQPSRHVYGCALFVFDNPFSSTYISRGKTIQLSWIILARYQSAYKLFKIQGKHIRIRTNLIVVLGPAFLSACLQTLA